MAYAQLAGLPAYFGLYAAFLPPMVAVLFGSSRQLATGPVAVVSLLTASALEPLAVVGTEGYALYAVLLALFVGLFQLLLGVLRLGTLLNLLSDAVVVGFTNAAAIIIATSQLDKLCGVIVEKTTHHFQTVWRIVIAASTETHGTTLTMGVLAFAIMLTLRRINPRLPGILIAAATTIFLSWLIRFDQHQNIKPTQIVDNAARTLVINVISERHNARSVKHKIVSAQRRRIKTKNDPSLGQRNTLKQGSVLHQRKQEHRQYTESASKIRKRLRELRFVIQPMPGGLHGEPRFAIYKTPQTHNEIWRIERINNNGTLTLTAGGQVLGSVPRGLPPFKLRGFGLQDVFQLFPIAITIAIIGFIEAISIAKAMAIKTHKLLNTNQELIGQGLANIAASLSQGYTVSGSFSRSAVNISAGAVTGFSSVISALMVMIALLWLTPLFYHLPQATLAAIIMMAVLGLVNVKAMRETWRTHPHDGIVATSTFALTLWFAPHLHYGVFIGVGMTLVLFVYRTTKPHLIMLLRGTRGVGPHITVEEAAAAGHISVVHLTDTLRAGTIDWLDEDIIEQVALKPDPKCIIIDGALTDTIDNRGERTLRTLTRRFQEAGAEVLFSRVRAPVLETLQQSGFIDWIGTEFFFGKIEDAFNYARQQLSEEDTDPH